MKKIAFLIFMLFVVSNSNEIDKKDFELSGLLNLSFDKNYTTLDKKLTKEYGIQIEPVLNYLLLDKFYIGTNISLSYLYTDFEKQNSTWLEYEFSPGVHLGLNFVKVKNIYPYIQTGINYCLIRMKSSPFDYYNHAMSIGVAGGVKFLIGKYLIIHTQLDYNHKVKYWSDSDFKNFNEKLKLKLGLGALINRN